MLARFTGTLFQIHAQHQRLTRGRYQQTAHHLKGGRFTRAVWPQQTKDFTAFDGKVDVIGGGKIAKFFGQFFRFDHRLTGCAFYRMQYCTQRRFRGSGTAQQINKRIFKTRRSFVDVDFRHPVGMANIVWCGLFFEDQTYRFPLNHAVADLRQFQCPLQQFAVALVRAGHQKAASGHGLCQGRRFSLVQQFAFVHQ